MTYPPIDLNKCADMIAEDGKLMKRLVELRGGCTCSCGWAPCTACSDELTEHEADLLGLLADDEEPAPDYSAITRGFCR